MPYLPTWPPPQITCPEGIDGDETEDLFWEVDGPVVLCDSVKPGADLEPDNHIVIDLEHGWRHVRATYRAEGDNQMVLAQLQPVPGHP